MDVLDLAWSAKGLLASGSVDNSVLLWQVYDGPNGRFLPSSRIQGPCQRLTQHTSFVKGVAFDPWGQILVSISDDHTICVWEPQITRHFSSSTATAPFYLLSKTLTGPLEHASDRVPFRRTSFSPDGVAIAIPSAVCSMNNGNNGSGTSTTTYSTTLLHSQLHTGTSVAASTAQQQPQEWDVLVHLFAESPSLCTRFCPLLLHQSPAQSTQSIADPAASDQMHTLIAVGEQSGSLSLWSSSSRAPVCVIQQLGSAPVCDVCWWVPVKPPQQPSSSAAGGDKVDAEVVCLVCTLAGEVLLLSLSQTDCTPSSAHSRGVVRDPTLLQAHLRSLSLPAPLSLSLPPTWEVYLGEKHGAVTGEQSRRSSDSTVEQHQQQHAQQDRNASIVQAWHPVARLYLTTEEAQPPDTDSHRDTDDEDNREGAERRAKAPAPQPSSAGSSAAQTTSASTSRLNTVSAQTGIPVATASTANTVTTIVNGKKRIRPVLLQDGDTVMNTTNDSSAEFNSQTGGELKKARHISFANDRDTATERGGEVRDNNRERNRENGREKHRDRHDENNSLMITVPLANNISGDNSQAFSYRSPLPFPLSEEDDVRRIPLLSLSSSSISSSSISSLSTSSFLTLRTLPTPSPLSLAPCLSVLSLSSSASLSSSLSPRWERVLEGQVSVIRAYSLASTPNNSEGMVCIGTSSGTLHLLSLSTGLPLSLPLILGVSVLDLYLSLTASTLPLLAVTGTGDISVYSLTTLSAVTVQVKLRYRTSLAAPLQSLRSAATQRLLTSATTTGASSLSVTLDNLSVVTGSEAASTAAVRLRADLSLRVTMQTTTASHHDGTKSSNHSSSTGSSSHSNSNSVMGGKGKPAGSTANAPAKSASKATSQTGPVSSSQSAQNGHHHSSNNMQQQQQHHLWTTRQSYLFDADADSWMALCTDDPDPFRSLGAPLMAGGGGASGVRETIAWAQHRLQSEGDGSAAASSSASSSVDPWLRLLALSQAEDRLTTALFLSPLSTTSSAHAITSSSAAGAEHEMIKTVSAPLRLWLNAALEAGMWKQIEDLCLQLAQQGGLSLLPVSSSSSSSSSSTSATASFARQHWSSVLSTQSAQQLLQSVVLPTLVRASLQTTSPSVASTSLHSHGHPSASADTTTEMNQQASSSRERLWALVEALHLLVQHK